MSVLSLAAVSVQRGSRALLAEVSLDVAAGETVGLVGESGAGKSTLVRVALGLERPHSGTVRWGIDDPWALSTAARRAARARLGAVFQQPAASLNPRRLIGASIGEPLLAHARALSARERQDRVAAALAQVGLPGQFAARWPDALSGGEAQRVALARALILKPALVILDEPTSALDASAAASVLNLMGELTRESGTAFVIVSHDLAAVAYVARRCLVLEAGRLVADGETDALYASATPPALSRLLAARTERFVPLSATR